MKIKLFILFFAFTAVVNAQSFAPDVIGSAGTDAVFVNGSMAWTIGEVITETYSSSNNFFTQGFHQPDTSSLVAVINISSETISIFPNPVINDLTIDCSGAPGSHTIYMYDMQGQLIRQGLIEANQKQLQIPFRDFANGIYLLTIVNSESNTRNTYKINKIK